MQEFPEYPAGCKIAQDKLEALRNEFEYWYPLDLRVSGKDLIGNHLTMSLYNHAAIWPDEAAQRWPRSFFTNGHVMIDHEKMSKSTGNFITLSDAIAEYSADATRFALADAGDGLEDANFERKSANAAILKLTKEEVWIKDIVEWDAKNPATPLRTGPLNFFDRVFLNELQSCVASADAAYAKLQFREALKYAFHQLTSERDNYKLALDAEKNSERMHKDVLQAYFSTLAITLAPLCPHFCQHIWEITGFAASKGIKFVARASWPAAAPIDLVLQRQMNYLRETALVLRKGLTEALIRFGKVPKGGEKPEKWIADIAAAATGGTLVATEVVKLLDRCTLYIAADYPEWQATVLKLISAAWTELNGRNPAEYPDRKLIIGKLRGALPAATPADKKAVENATKFANSVLEDLALRGAAALELASPFSEQELLEANWDFVLRDLGITKQNIAIKQGAEGPALPAPVAGAGAAASPEIQAITIEALAAGKALPGRPSPYFYKAKA